LPHFGESELSSPQSLGKKKLPARQSYLTRLSAAGWLAEGIPAESALSAKFGDFFFNFPNEAGIGRLVWRLAPGLALRDFCQS